jgi:hypothetical protein
MNSTKPTPLTAQPTELQVTSRTRVKPTIQITIPCTSISPQLRLRGPTLVERLSPSHPSTDTPVSEASIDDISKQAQAWVKARQREHQRRMADTGCFMRAAESSRQIQELIKVNPVILPSKNKTYQIPKESRVNRCPLNLLKSIPKHHL